MQKHRKLLGVVALGLLGAEAFSLRWWNGPEAAVERVAQRGFVQSVVASGHVETPTASMSPHRSPRPCCGFRWLRVGG